MIVFRSRFLLALLVMTAAVHAQTAPPAKTAAVPDHVHSAARPKSESAAGVSSEADGNLGGIEVDFELLDRNGKLVRDEDFRGRYVVLAFGFTHCPYVCPTLVFNIGAALAASDKKAVGIFISVDTERDTPAINDDYAVRFGDAMMGLGGSYEQVNEAANHFKVSYAVTKTQNNYTVQHTANIYVIDPAGTLLDVLPFNTKAPDIEKALL
jgi:protein SCO1